METQIRDRVYVSPSRYLRANLLEFVEQKTCYHIPRGVSSRIEP